MIPHQVNSSRWNCTCFQQEMKNKGLKKIDTDRVVHTLPPTILSNSLLSSCSQKVTHAAPWGEEGHLSSCTDDNQMNTSNHPTIAPKRKMESSKLYYNFLFSIHQTNVKYPVPPEEEEKRWQSIVTKSLNAKCRGARASKRRQQLRINSTCTNSETALHVHRHWFFVVRCSMLYAFVVCQGNLTKST